MSFASSDLPDILGLHRLEAALNAQEDAAPSESAAAESLFVLKPDSAAAAAPLDESPSDSRQAALDWLDEFAKNQVLFQHRDVDEWRRALSTDEDEEVVRWLSDSHELRERLSDDSWKMTQKWLHDFLAVQAIYDDDRIAANRVRFASLRPRQLMRVLDHFQSVHLARIHSRQVAENMRTRQISTFRPSEGSARPSTRAAYFQGSSGFPSSVGNYVATGSSRNLYNAGQASLSRRVASYYVYRDLFGRGAYWLWFW